MFRHADGGTHFSRSSHIELFWTEIKTDDCKDILCEVAWEVSGNVINSVAINTGIEVLEAYARVSKKAWCRKRGHVICKHCIGRLKCGEGFCRAHCRTCPILSDDVGRMNVILLR